MKRMLECCVLGLWLLATVGASASTIQSQTDEELADTADTIVVGTCIAGESVWVGKNIYTKVTLAVEDTVKGNAVQQVVVMVPGGVGEVTGDLGTLPVVQKVEGAPTFYDGEKVFVFLEDASSLGNFGPSSYQVSGFSQGKLAVIPDAQGNERVVRNLEGVTFSDGSHAEATADAVSLQEFKQKIQDALGN